MQRRPRQEFATGARTLRGGKNHYTAKTLCGNWVEAQYDPEFESLARESKYDALCMTMIGTGRSGAI